MSTSNMGNMERKRHELYEDIRAHVIDEMKNYLIEEDVADQVAIAIINRLSTHWGGSTFSFPKDMLFQTSQRNLEIWNKFTGNNHRELAQEFGITENAIYQITKMMKERFIKANQQDLFN